MGAPPGLLRLVLLLLLPGAAALRDFSGYLTKLLQNHTVYACDGDHLNLQCPRHSTISVQSAFYGQDYQMCSTQQSETTRKDPLNCVATTTLQKVLDECQNQRACQLLVNSRVFGPDLCPGTTKYLLVSFKCKPSPTITVLVLLFTCAAACGEVPKINTEYKTKSACENQELKLHCHESKFINIYSATYGRLAHEKDICSTEADHAPPFDCLSYTALDVLSKRCYGKQRCKIVVNHNDFGSPCLPGVKKYLNVNYTCVPKIILTAVDPMVANLNPTLNQKDSKYDVNFDPKGSRSPKKDGTIVSSSLATFAYIRDHPERAALLFVSSVCIGLVFTLCALVVRVSCTNDFQRLHRIRTHFEPGSDQADGNSENDEEEDSSDSDFPDELTRFCRTPYSGYNSTEAAELAERIERRDQVIQEIWMNSGLDMTPPRSIDPFYIPKQ